MTTQTASGQSSSDKKTTVQAPFEANKIVLPSSIYSVCNLPHVEGDLLSRYKNAQSTGHYFAMDQARMNLDISNLFSKNAVDDISPSGKSHEEIRQEVITALENKNYDWRSIDGISRETHLPKGEIKDTIKQLIKEGSVIYAPYKNKKGHRLYTTVKQYRKTRGILVRIVSTLTDRVI